MADLFLTPYVRTMWQLLRQRLGDAGRMCIFGAGAHTRWLLSVTADLPAPDIVAILDDEPTDESIAGVEVRRPDAVDVDAIDLVLVSSDRWEAELTRRCHELWSDRVEVVQLYRGLPRGPYDKSDDRGVALHRLSILPSTKPLDVDRVVIVADRPGPREAKLGFGLSHEHRHPVLLYRRPPSFAPLQYFESALSFNNEWEALRLACDFAPAVFHVSVNGSYRVAELFLQHRPGIIVVDPYDCVAGMLSDEFLSTHRDFADEIGRERFCLEQADGVCARSREVEFLVDRFGYRIRRHLLFVDACWDRAVKASSGGKELHTVYAGHLEPSRDRCETFTGHGSKLWLAQTLAEQRIHFHLYPWFDLQGVDFEQGFAAYRDLERATPYFHLHKPVAPDRLIAELSQYDLAMFAYNESVNPDSFVPCFTADKFRFATSNKVFDFIDAGLPVAYTGGDDAFITQILDLHGVRIDLRDVDPGEWGRLLRSLDLAPWRERVGLARRDFSVRRRITELCSFYESLLSPSAESGFSGGKTTEESMYDDRTSRHRPVVVR